MILFFYRIALIFLTPLLWWHLAMRVKSGKEDKNRVRERYGMTDENLPSRPIWIHAASVGEAIAALQIISRLQSVHPVIPVLMTTGTVTSAQVMAKRLPHNCVHQYAPLDHPVWVARFLNHWNPMAAIRLESEIWPETLSALHARHIPAALLNAHLSPTSHRHWKMAKGLFQSLLKPFRLILAEDDATLTALRDLGVDQAQRMDNLKLMADTLPIIPDDLTALKTMLGARPCWLSASTHQGEETLAAQVHNQIKAHVPSALTIIVPRHPNRAPKIVQQIKATYPSLHIAQRSLGTVIAPETDIYLADTMGELGLFYAACPFAVIGRSFSDDGGGGHNPVEAVQLGCFPISGPHVQNLTSIFDALRAIDAVEIVPQADQLAGRVEHYLTHPTEIQQRADTALNALQNVQSRLGQQLDAALTTFMKEVMP